MTPGEADDAIELPASPEAASPRTPLRERAWVRRAIVTAVGLGSLAATLVVTYELALARMPEHRAALERLVRAQTGLDVRFNELGFRWGWYGPEAVFQRVELAEPGNASVVLRAPQLTVGFDAWRTVRTGHLSPGRITLVAPDIDLEKLTHRREAVSAGTAVPNAESTASTAAQRTEVLQRWRNGRVDLQGGTLRLPGPTAGSGPVTLHIRRAYLRKSDDEWNGFGLVFLPERLGRTARIVVQVRGDLAQPRTLNGALRFEGMRIAFAGWREVFAGFPSLAGNLPAAGSGDITLHLTLQDGRIDKADGQVRATDVVLSVPAWAPMDRPGAPPSQASRAALSLDYVSGDWRFARRQGGAQLQIEQLALSREEKDAPLPRISVEFSPQHVRGDVANAPLSSAARVASWLAPQLVPDDLELKGTLQDIDVDWNAARPDGEHLAASAHASDARIGSRSQGVRLDGLRTRFIGSESRVTVEMSAHAATLEREGAAAPLEGLQVASSLEWRRVGDGWSLTMPALNVTHEIGEFSLSGTVSSQTEGAVPQIDARGALANADVARLQEQFATNLIRWFGPQATRLASGRIEEGRFEVRGPLDSSKAPERVAGVTPPASFKGSLTLHDARIAADGMLPEAVGMEATLSWNGPLIHAMVSEGRAGAFNLDNVDAQWDASGERASHVSGRAKARVERALAWMRQNPELQEQVPHLQDLVARGDALLDFDVSRAADGAKPRVRVATVLDDVQFRVAPELPPVEALRGSLAFDSGRLQRSTLNGTWLGGPLTLRISERSDRRGRAMAVQAQGTIDATKLVALTQIKHLPEVSGETPWSGDFVYFSPTPTQPARWQGHADGTLLGIASELPAPFAKEAESSLPIRVEIAGSGDTSEVHVNLMDRARTAFAVQLSEGRDWRIERGTIQVGTALQTGAPALPADEVISVQGRVKRLDLPAYVAMWQQLRKDANSAPAVVDISADEMLLGNRVALNASVHASPMKGGTSLRVESKSLGLLTGTLTAGTPNVVLKDLRLTREALTGEGSIECTADVSSCEGQFALTTDDAAATLADLGFLPELNATRGSLSGKLKWQPRAERPWLETATGDLTMHFEDGVTRHLDDADGRRFPLLTVPALLSGMARPGVATVPAEPMRFKRIDAQFELRDGQAFTSDLHFDGDAEILMRGRTGLLARDYDHEAWVLRGEERIPASLRRLGATPRVAAAWMSLRELVRGESEDRSRVVLHLRGSWNEPVVTVD
jgi:uncharacterized protein YhdP